MSDLYLALGIVGCIFVVAFGVALDVGRRVSRRTGTILTAIVVGLIVAHIVFVSDQLWVTRLVPLTSVPVLGNADLLALVAALMGLAWRVTPGHVGRRVTLVAALFAVCLHRTLYPVFASPPTNLGNQWRGTVCLQTSPATCSPSAAATLLRSYGISANEAGDGPTLPQQ